MFNKRVHRIPTDKTLTATEKHLFGYLDYKREKHGNGFKLTPSELTHVGSPSKVSEAFTGLIAKELVFYQNGINNQRYNICVTRILHAKEYITITDGDLEQAGGNIHAAMIWHRWQHLVEQGYRVILTKFADTLGLSLSTVKRWANKMRLCQPGQKPKTEDQNPKVSGQNPKTLQLVNNSVNNNSKAKDSITWPVVDNPANVIRESLRGDLYRLANVFVKPKDRHRFVNACLGQNRLNNYQIPFDVFMVAASNYSENGYDIGPIDGLIGYTIGTINNYQANQK